MIRIIAPSVATSVQDQGRFGYRGRGLSRAGAMDPLSLAYVNRLLQNDVGAAGIEFGPGPMQFEVIAPTLLAFGGAPRDGAPWWSIIEAAAGDEFTMSAPRHGIWSYLAVQGGVDAPLVMGSRSANVREQIGSWIKRGDVLGAASADAAAGPRGTISIIPESPPTLEGPIRTYGDVPGEWNVGTRLDRMGYRLEGTQLSPGPQDDWSEPILPGCIQITPAGAPYVLMVEGSTVGGYRVAAVIHSADLRLVAQRRPGESLEFVTIG